MSKAAAKTFDREVAGKNVITPHRMYVGYTKDGGIWELNEGDDFDRNLIYGVTVIVKDPVQGWHPDHDRSKLFNREYGLSTTHRLKAAIKYIEEELQ
jgi:hypothetical protein